VKQLTIFLFLVSSYSGTKSALRAKWEGVYARNSTRPLYRYPVAARPCAPCRACRPSCVIRVLLLLIAYTFVPRLACVTDVCAQIFKITCLSVSTTTTRVRKWANHDEANACKKVIARLLNMNHSSLDFFVQPPACH
jgi:hypothetical protein